MREIELIEKRGKREKHFLQENGEIIARVYSDDIHFLKNGKYEEIDNTLLKEGKCYVNKNNKYKVSFNEDIKDGLMNIELDNHYLKFILKDGKASLLKKKNDKSKLFKKINYENVFDNIDFEYDINPTKVKEGIVLKDKSAVRTKLCFNVLTDLTLTLLEDGSIDAEYEGNHVFKIDAPYMLDSNNVINKNVFYKLKDKNGQYELSLDLDQKWLNEPTTKYPVYVDPTINVDETANVYDTYIYPGDTGVNRNSQDILKVGVERINGVDVVNRALIKFDLPTIGTGSQITSALMYLYPYPGLEDMDFYDYVNTHVAIHQVTSSWTESGANWNEMNDKFNPRILNWLAGRRSINGYDIYPEGHNITEIVKKWYSDTPNYGVMLKDINEVYQNELVPAFFSKNNLITEGSPIPYLEITYKNYNGLENYIEYADNIFNGGIQYLNLHTGNLVTAFDLLKTKAKKLPVALKLFYNTNDVVLENNFGYGKGYKLSLNQTIKEIKENDEILFLEYCDEDGTLHYFNSTKYYYDDEGIPNEIVGENEYYDEDGLNKTIIKDGENYILKDTENNSMHFYKSGESWLLRKIVDAGNNEVNITYTNNVISKVTDSDNQEINITYETNLVKFQFENEIVKLLYTNGNITTIQTQMGNILFTYDNKGCVTSIQDISGKKLVYEYYDQAPYRVKKITEYGLNNTLGNSVNLTYGFNLTTVVDSMDRASTYIFKNNGTLSSVTDLKHHDDLDDAYAVNQMFGEFAQDTNKLINKQNSLKYSKNLLTDSSFEQGNVGFESNNAITAEIHTNTVRTGSKCLSLRNSTSGNIRKTISVKKGKNYTFSAYFKNNYDFSLWLSNDNLEGEHRNIYTNSEFTRYDVSFCYPMDDAGEYGNLYINISMGNNVDLLLIDDMQLEEGLVANNYNYIENSDFSTGLQGWTFQALEQSTGNEITNKTIGEVVTLANGKNALRINMNPNYNSSFSYDINLSGKQGDVYNISFWYKNGGIECNSYDGMGEKTNNIIIAFNYIDQDEGYGVFPSDELNPNKDEWQFFTCNFQAEKDYSSISFSGWQNGNANELYITNVCLYKDIGTEGCLYDENGNLKKVIGLSDEEKTLNYDKNNQVVKAYDTPDEYTSIEYDNTYVGRVLRGVTSKGICNEYVFDANGNPILNKLAFYNQNDEITDGLYRIRLKGTRKYLKGIGRRLVIGDDNSCYDLWNVTKDGDYYRINHGIFTALYIVINSTNVVLKKLQDDSGLFSLIKNDNGSYTLKCKSNSKFLKFNDAISISDTDDETYEFELYFEKCENPLFMETDLEYDESGKYLLSVIDTRLNKIIYDIDEETGLTKSVTEPNGSITTFEYNNKKLLVKKTEGDKVVEYTYNDNEQVTKIKQGDREYNLIYDEFFNIKQIKFNDIILSTNNYESITENLLSTVMGNGNTISYEYDDYDRVVKMTTMNNVYNFEYGNSGQLLKVISNDDVLRYVYDLSRKLREFYNNDFKIKYDYDINDNLIEKEFTNGIFDYVISHSYDTDENITETIFNIVNKTNNKQCNVSSKYEYDYLGRITQKSINNTPKTSYEYITNGNRTSDVIESVQLGNDKYSYKYDEIDNITHIYHNDNLINKYQYGVNKELVLEFDYKNNRKIKYTYDDNGNILSKEIYCITDNSFIDKISYQYNNTSWKDQLTNYNGKNITYDAIGNPLTIGDVELKWRNGNELYEYNKGNDKVIFDYNSDGVRTSKKVNNVTTKYYLEEKNIITEENENYSLHYMYDEIDNLIGFVYNDGVEFKPYYYIKNAQLDIIGILDSNQNIVCRYEYDSWGNILSIVDGEGNDVSANPNHIANINPFRYRCYYYDRETGFYLLGERYYSPEFGRFISCDINISDDAFGNNLYVYCGNNPTSRIDIDGQVWFTVAKLAAGALCGFVGNAISNLAAGKSILDGAVGATVGGAVGAVFGGVAGNIVSNGLNEVMEYTRFSSGERKKVTSTNIMTSIAEVTVDTLTDCAFDKVVDNKVSKYFPKVRGRKPKTFESSFTGKHAVANYLETSTKTLIGTAKDIVTEPLEVLKPKQNQIVKFGKTLEATIKVKIAKVKHKFSKYINYLTKLF